MRHPNRELPRSNATRKLYDDVGLFSGAELSSLFMSIELACPKFTEQRTNASVIHDAAPCAATLVCRFSLSLSPSLCLCPCPSSHLCHQSSRQELFSTASSPISSGQPFVRLNSQIWRGAACEEASSVSSCILCGKCLSESAPLSRRFRPLGRRPSPDCTAFRTHFATIPNKLVGRSNAIRDQIDIREKMQ